MCVQERRQIAEEEKTAMEDEMKRAEELIKARKEQATAVTGTIRQYVSHSLSFLTFIFYLLVIFTSLTF